MEIKHVDYNSRKVFYRANNVDYVGTLCGYVSTVFVRKFGALVKAGVYNCTFKNGSVSKKFETSKGLYFEKEKLIHVKSNTGTKREVRFFEAVKIERTN